MHTVSAPKRSVHLSMRTATRAGTCFEAVASALRASAGLRAAADAADVETGAQSKLGPTQTAKFEADIILWEEFATMCRSTQRKWRNSVTLALGSRSHNLDKSEKYSKLVKKKSTQVLLRNFYTL